MLSQKKCIYYTANQTPTSFLAVSLPYQDPNLTPGPAVANAGGAAEEAVGKPTPPRVDLIEFVIGRNSK